MVSRGSEKSFLAKKIKAYTIFRSHFHAHNFDPWNHLFLSSKNWKLSVRDLVDSTYFSKAQNIHASHQPFLSAFVSSIKQSWATHHVSTTSAYTNGFAGAIMNKPTYFWSVAIFIWVLGAENEVLGCFLLCLGVWVYCAPCGVAYAVRHHAPTFAHLWILLQSWMWAKNINLDAL